MRSELSEKSEILDVRYVAEAIRVASYIHADLIRIHPFIDGNGRIGRVSLDWHLLASGLPMSVAFHIPSEEYRDALNGYYATGRIELISDLVLRVFSFAMT